MSASVLAWPVVSRCFWRLPLALLMHKCFGRRVYSPPNLNIAYGASIFTTVIIVAIGLFCIAEVSQSYGISFSTVLRTTRNAELDRLVDANETNSAEPLSERLAKTRLKFWACRLAGDSLPEYSAFVLAQNGPLSYGS